MPSDTNLAHLGMLIKARRNEKNLGLRAAAKECGLSPSTLSRLERGIGAAPDAETMAKLSEWLGISVGELLFGEESGYETPRNLTTPEIVQVHLRADKNLSPKTAETLAQMFHMLYDRLSSAEADQQENE